MTDFPFQKRSRQSFFIGVGFIVIGLTAYISSLKTDADLIAVMPPSIKNGATAALISVDPDHLCAELQPAWVAILTRASEKKSARLAAELAARSFADLASEPKLADETKYKCLLQSVQATRSAEQNLRDGVLLRKMRKVTAEQLSLAAIDGSAQLYTDSLAEKMKSQTSKIESLKAQIKSTQILTGQMLRQREKGLYEITDAKGHPGLLKTSRTFFQKKSAFAIAARNTKLVDVKLSEAEGNFDATWMVWEETTNAKELEKTLAFSRAELASTKKTIAAQQVKAKAASNRRTLQMRKAFAAIASEYDGLTGRSIQEMTAN